MFLNNLTHTFTSKHTCTSHHTHTSLPITPFHPENRLPLHVFTIIHLCSNTSTLKRLAATGPVQTWQPVRSRGFQSNTGSGNVFSSSTDAKTMLHDDKGPCLRTQKGTTFQCTFWAIIFYHHVQIRAQRFFDVY